MSVAGTLALASTIVWFTGAAVWTAAGLVAVGYLAVIVIMGVIVPWLAKIAGGI